MTMNTSSHLYNIMIYYDILWYHNIYIPGASFVLFFFGCLGFVPESWKRARIHRRCQTSNFLEIECFPLWMMHHPLICSLVAIWPEQKGAPDPPTSASQCPLSFCIAAVHAHRDTPISINSFAPWLSDIPIIPNHMQHLAKTLVRSLLAMSAFDADPNVLQAWHENDTLSNRAMSCCKLPNILSKKISRSDVIENYLLLNPIIEHLGCKPHIESITSLCRTFLWQKRPRGKPEPTSGLHDISFGCVLFFLRGLVHFTYSFLWDTPVCDWIYSILKNMNLCSFNTSTL